MPFDLHKNLAIATVATAPTPPTSGTSIVVAFGDGARFPAAPFNATVWPVSQLPTPVNAEVVRVTAIAGDGLTILRAQEGTGARSIIAGDLIAVTITNKTLTDIESGINFPQIQTPGQISTGTTIVSNNPTIQAVFIGEGATTGPNFARIGNAVTTAYFGVDSAAGTFGSPNSVMVQSSSAAGINLLAVHPGGGIKFTPGGYSPRGMMHPSGGLSWGSQVDPGAGQVLIGTGTAAGVTHTLLAPGFVQLGTAVATATPLMYFANPNSVVGSIQVTGTTTAYNTTSDARLKTDRGVQTDLEVLRRTVIHTFTWTADGTPGRGVFAQEAIAVAPFAVAEGTDETDTEGRLTRPWGVDYAKYVPDLIVGWQAHDAKVAELEATVARLEATLAALLERLE